MNVEINWLLLSDLHIGLDNQKWFWPNCHFCDYHLH